MENFSESNYITERLDDQITWYSNKSGACQKKYKGLQIASLIFSSLIPVIGGISALCSLYEPVALIISSLFAAIVTVNQSICKMNKYHENWIQYRYIAELLKHEKFLYITKTAPYDQEFAFNFLVERAERIISSENVNWVGINEPDNKHQSLVTGSSSEASS